MIRSQVAASRSRKQRFKEQVKIAFCIKPDFFRKVKPHFLTCGARISALEEQLAQVTKALEQRAGKYCDRPDDMPLMAIVHAAFNVLESRLAQRAKADGAREIVTELESLTLDQVEEKQ